MVEFTASVAHKVVNLADYRAARITRELPLLDANTNGTLDTHAQPDTSLAPAPAPARALGTRQVEHRERMLRHLAGR